MTKAGSVSFRNEVCGWLVLHGNGSLWAGGWKKEQLRGREGRLHWFDVKEWGNSREDGGIG
jgi:hypothetical protein